MSHDIEKGAPELLPGQIEEFDPTMKFVRVPTTVTGAWLEDVQSELAQAVEDAGLLDSARADARCAYCGRGGRGELQGGTCEGCGAPR